MGESREAFCGSMQAEGNSEQVMTNLLTVDESHD